MNYYRFPENRMTKALFGLFLSALLLLVRDTMLSSAVIGFYRAQALMLCLVAAAGAAFLFCQRRSLKAVLLDRRMALAIAVTVVLLLPMVVKRDWQLMYFSVLICLYIAIFMSYFITLQEAAKYYVVILSVLALYSLAAAYGLRQLPDRGIVPVPTFINGANFEFYNFGLATVPLTYVKNRNFGIFREPGVYQFFLLLGLYLNHYWVAWKKDAHMWLVSAILAVTMLSTFATGGVIEMALFAVFLFFDKKLYRDRRIRRIAIAGAVVLAAVLAVSAIQRNTLYRELYAMLVTKFSDKEDSYVERMDAIFVDLNFILHSPLIGSRLSDVLHAVPNNTTSTLIMLAVFGIGGGALHLLCWAALVWERKRPVLGNLILLGILCMSFNTQCLIADVFLWLFPMMALTERVLPLVKIRKKECSNEQ